MLIFNMIRFKVLEITWCGWWETAISCIPHRIPRAWIEELT